MEKLLLNNKVYSCYEYLHLEIRKSFYDYGCASWLTMNKNDLNELFYNPMTFMKNNLGAVQQTNPKTLITDNANQMKKIVRRTYISIE